MIVIITSCYSNGSEGPHRSHRTDRPRRSLSPNGISVGAAVFVAGGHAQRRQTDRLRNAKVCVGIGLVYAVHSMRPNVVWLGN